MSTSQMPDPNQPAQVSPEEQQEEQPQGSEAMGWVALYLPAYGTSFLLHVAIVLILWFFSWQVTAIPAETHFQYKSTVEVENKTKIVKRTEPVKKQPVKTTQKDNQPKSDRPGSGRGKFKPGPSSIVRQFTENPFPDVADNGLQQLDVIGVGGGGHHIGGWEGLGNGGRGGFFGAGGDEEGPRKFVYIVDRSGSMTDSIDFVKYELKRSISELSDEQEFHVIFYSSGPPVEMPTRRLVNATERNKQLAFEFIDGIVPQGETDPSKALERAFACSPELIYLLTDGEFDRSIIDLCKRLNSGGKVTIHTICFLYQSGSEVLKQIAADNGGNYKLVTEQDLANLSR
jgi:hypothetical protein